ncbi:hypothetical protein PCANC_23580 [Puccinia coronata f. sp. avenae]|uniref:Uncharacterized protein n=1 Tax=Puccinia coronata f. sp. avenae TaxID=200324 RepID=A0A2N5TLY2_9BASI|nr:hypothetical protein PCANC_23580 [Puccinia coronata f. sp. avenae]PLW51102.1 hypothetical protein PCASD_02450 [Puccinia coronata f. sp. avenae]
MASRGLAIIFVEKNRFDGKNNLSAFEEGGSQDDNDRMDALALTPICLRIALAIDNQSPQRLKGVSRLVRDDSTPRGGNLDILITNKVTKQCAYWSTGDSSSEMTEGSPEGDKLLW